MRFGPDRELRGALRLRLVRPDLAGAMTARRRAGVQEAVRRQDHCKDTSSGAATTGPPPIGTAWSTRPTPRPPARVHQEAHGPVADAILPVQEGD
jgi:hypothetical protein